jgi:transposase
MNFKNISIRLTSKITPFTSIFALKTQRSLKNKKEFVCQYQRPSIERNQAIAIRAIKGKTFKETAENYKSSATSIFLRFNQI